MKRRILFLTGNPGVGKTTLLVEIVKSLKGEGFNVGGMVTREVRENGVRVGFEITNLLDDSHGWLAKVYQESGPRVGRYRVILEDLGHIGAKAIIDAVKKSDVVAIDEIGPMELFSDDFKKAVTKAIESDKLVVGVIHKNARDSLIEAIRRRQDVQIEVVTRENRDKLREIVPRKAIEFLRYAERETERVHL
jgi:nucleoside-triphosphatase